MKFLTMLVALTSLSAFAQVPESTYIKCYEAPQQTGHWDLTHKFKVTGEDIELVYPENIDLGVLVYDTDPSSRGWQCLADTESDESFEACRAEGQNIRGLVPISINDEETVYCQREILDWVSGYPMED